MQVTARTDHYYNNAAERVADQANVGAGETATDRDTGDVYQRITAGWAWVVSGGTPHVTLRDSLMGPEGAAAGQPIGNTTASQQTSAIAGDAVDISTDSTDDVFIEIGSNPTAVVDTSYHLTSNVTHRFPITSGNKVAVISTGTNGKTWTHPVQ
jgi:hypothetical protein